VRRIGELVISLCFVAALITFGILAVVLPKPTFSDIENRPLATAPPLVTDGGVNREFFGELDKFYSDTFPFREKFLLVNRKINALRTLSPFSSDDDVVLIPVAHGDTQATPVPEETPTPTPEPTPDNPDATAPPPDVTATPAPIPTPTPEPDDPNAVISSVAIVGGRAFELYLYDAAKSAKYAQIIDELAEKCAVPTYVLLFPCASELYLPAKYRGPENEQSQAISAIASALKTAIPVDLSGDFAAARDEYLYFRTDHHWTAEGAYVAYRGFMNAQGITAPRLADMGSGEREGYLGSLYKQILQDGRSEQFESNPDVVRYFYPSYAAKAVNYTDAAMTGGKARKIIDPDYDVDTNLYSLFFGGDMQLMHMHSEVNNGRSIMVVRDSYGHAFLPYLINDYEDVYAVEPRYFTSFALADFIAGNDIDELLFVNSPLVAMGGYWMSWPGELEKLK
jgi:hypothetical protein